MNGESASCDDCVDRAGTKNGNWKGGISHHRKGYRYVLQREHPRATKGGYVLEHVIVMEQVLGRQLLPGENVHHLNGQREDNRPENLELWIRPHPSGIRVQDAVAWAQEILLRFGNR